MFRGLLACLAIGGVLAALPVAGADAQSNPLSRLVGRDAERQAGSVWFERADGRGRFIFDRTGRPALILPEGSDEVIAVYPARASGGGEVWQSDTGRVVLRFSNLGGATYFPPDAPDGVIADPVGEARLIAAEPASAEELQRAARRMVDSLASRARREVSAEVLDAGPGANAYIIDAMRMVARAADDTPRRALRDLEVVRIGIGEAPRADYSAGVLDISVNPAMGYGGRPSSGLIQRELERAG